MSETKIVWHPYPKEIPLRNDLFLVTEIYGSLKAITVSAFLDDGFKNDENTVAWAETPEPYDGPIHHNKRHEKLIFDEEKQNGR